MKTIFKKPLSASAAERTAVKLLMEKMCISKKEWQEINNISGVSALKMIELMELSKYRFINHEEIPGRCQPCKIGGNRMTVSKFW